MTPEVNNAAASAAAAPLFGSARLTRSRLFRKFVLLFIVLVGGVLLASGGLELWFSYQENKTALARLQQEKAAAAASRIEQYMGEITRQIAWSSRAQRSSSGIEQSRLEYLRLLGQVPAITEVAHISADGREQLRVSRLSVDVIGSGVDRSSEPQFTEVNQGEPWFSPVYFRRDSEPYISVAVAAAGRNGGVTVAELNLKFIWDVISRIRIGEGGYAYVVDASGWLIAHPDIGLVLRRTSLSPLPQVVAALAPSADSEGREADPAVGKDFSGRPILTAHATIAPLHWVVFVDLPLSEAYAPLYASLIRAAALALIGLLLAVIAGLFLARRIVGPIAALQQGATRIGQGDLGHRINIRTRDELELLADRFNDMAGRLQESYLTLEEKVETRTKELSEALEQQTATSEILRVISTSPNDAQPVFETIVRNAVALCDGLFANVFGFDGELVHFVASHNTRPDFVELLRAKYPMPPDASQVSGRVVLTRSVVRVEDVLTDPDYDQRFPVAMGWRRLLGVPMLRQGELLGVIVVGWAEPGPIPNTQEELLKTFADQAVITIQNVQVFSELEARTQELARSVHELRALGEVSRAVSSTLNLEAVLSTIVSRAVELSESYSGIIYEFDEKARAFHARASHRITAQHLEALRSAPVHLGEGAIGRAGVTLQPVEISDLEREDEFVAPQVRDIVKREGFRSLLAVPLISKERVQGGLVILRREQSRFSPEVIRTLQTFAAQSMLALQNARMFQEIEDKSRDLELASRHKSQFLANMSHELRTPLNAILGYSELILDNIYGEIPEKARSALERVQINGKHLLGLINAVLDLSKIEAGKLTLSLGAYSLNEVVASVVDAVENLAAEKNISLKVEIATDLPVGHGDEQRIRQVLLNLVGNAIKFTEAGEVAVFAVATDGAFEISVSDTGPGISAADQAKLFQEFQQADASSTRKIGGTGLGLAISKRFVELHGGHIWAESTPGVGTTFRFTIPIMAEAREEAA